MRFLLAAASFFVASSAFAEPFDECPSKAFLTQGRISQTYSVNLVTGDYQMLASDMGTTGVINALGFNPEDRYIYGWSYIHNSPARVTKDFQVEALPVTNIASKGFYIGDVSPTTNKYYVYRAGSNYGLYSIGLDPEADDYLQMNRIVDGGTFHMSTADMAFHPSNGQGYAVDNKGKLHQFSADDGSSTVIADLGITGWFGAAYFDVDGNLYVSRNKDGKVFRIAIDSGVYEAEFFAQGPASSTNDGSRCALAPAVDVSDTNLDFGDAPDSYGTTLASNGPRHGLSSNNTVYLGSSVDGESDAFAAPLSDDDNKESDDEDGVQFATNIIEDTNAIAAIKSSTAAYLSAWIDINRNGTFDDNEQVLTDYITKPGTDYVYIPIPAGVKTGDSWARFRLSSNPGLLATGGAIDGEVEDYKVVLIEKEATVTYYPSANGFTTLAFEDNWPHEGDYDMNDLIVRMRTAVWSRPLGVTQVNISGHIAAVGAAYHNGFGIRLPGVSRDQVDIENMEYTINGKPVTFQALENNRNEAILIVAYNVWEYVGSGELCTFYRTEAGCGSDIEMRFEASIPMLDPVDAELSGAFDPFLFATPGAWHGGHFVEAPGRSYEIHMKNQAPTEAFDQNLFSEPGDDTSDIASNQYFQTANGLPWALEMGTDWEYPKEYIDMGYAYPYFSSWATSAGTKNKFWYLGEYGNPTLIFTD